MINKRLFVVFFCVFLAIALTAAGCRRHASTEDKVERVIQYLTDDLSLTAEQEDILENFKLDFVERIKKVKMTHRGVRDEVLEQIKSDVMDQDKLKAEISLVKSEIDETITFVISSMAEFHGTLSAEQKDLLVDKIEGLRKLHGCN